VNLQVDVLADPRRDNALRMAVVPDISLDVDAWPVPNGID
jgi:hypothetical protein